MEAGLTSLRHSRLNFQMQRYQVTSGQSCPKSVPEVFTRARGSTSTITMVASKVSQPSLSFMNLNTAARMNSVTTVTNGNKIFRLFWLHITTKFTISLLLMLAATEVVFVPISWESAARAEWTVLRIEGRLIVKLGNEGVRYLTTIQTTLVDGPAPSEFYWERYKRLVWR